VTYQTINRYQIKEVLSRGMTTVYHASDPDLEHDVLIKVLPAEILAEAASRAQFEQQAELLAALQEPALVPIYDVGEHDGQPYLVMPLWQGNTLADRLQGAPLSLAEAADLISQLAPAIDAAHQQGLIHRDLKPDNIWFDEANQPHIADFGLVTLSGASEQLRMNHLLGTPAYMSPEVGTTEKLPSKRSDIYSLGVMLFEMLTGQLPYQAQSGGKLLVKHILEPVPNILQVNPDLPASSQVLIVRTMAKKPSDRFATASELADALRTVAEGGEVAIPESLALNPDASPTLQLVKEPAPPTESLLPADPSPEATASSSWLWVPGTVLLLLIIGGIALAAMSGAFGEAPTTVAEQAAASAEAAPAAEAAPSDSKIEAEGQIPDAYNGEAAADAPAAQPTEATTPAEPAESAPQLESLAGPPSSDLPPPPAEMGRIAFMGPFGQSNVLQAYIINADGTGLTPLTEDLGEGYFPNLSPDGNRVLVIANTTVDPDIFVIDVTSGESTNLTNTPGFDNQPVWSPDGSQIAFVTDREGGDVDIWVMNADGTESRRVARTAGDDKLGSWSPDSKQIVYSNVDENGESLSIINVESGETSPLTEGGSGVDSAPTWSPDGSTIAYHSSPNASAFPLVYTIKPDGTNREQISHNSGPSLFPIWSPDSQWLVFTSIVGERRDLVAVDLESYQARVLPNVQGFPTSWRATDQLLAESDYSQGPKQTGVEVTPEVLQAAYRKGSPDAPVKIIEFSDYQCPFCQRWVGDTLPELEPYIEDGTIQLIFVDFPLNIHPQAPAASQAAHCAGELGGSDGYWQMHDALFMSMNEWSGQSQPAPIFNQVASNMGLDGAAIQECVESERFSAVVNAGLQEGVRLGVSGTPTFFINGTRLVGAQPWSAFEPFIKQGGGQ
jgi:serine/threonine protein kinase/Tol biopolymer transport system component/predicted DsbA family dithiol-disulfide isomerase